MRLETERLILRRWTEYDAESLYEYAKDPAIGPIAGWPPHKSVEESLNIIKTVFMCNECYAICEKDKDVAIGAISLKLKGQTDMTDRDDECELGYWIGKPFWGRGYMPEAANELLRHGFEDLGMTTIWCGYYDGNTKSKRVQEKLGFLYHHTCDEVPVPLLNEIRVGHTNYMTKERWEEMNQYITGAVIKELREKSGLTQAEFADKLNISSKAISKRETAKGYPDISLLEPLANVFGVSITELISGNAVKNVNVSANMLRSKFYVCPVCGNIIHTMGRL